MPRVQPALELTHVTEWLNGTDRRIEDHLAVEEPLEIRIDGKPLTVTMRTPGHDEELAAGFFWTEGLIESPGQIVEVRKISVKNAARDNIVSVELGDHSFDPELLQRNFFAASSCGICGKASIAAIRVRGLTHPNADFRIDPELLCALPALLRDQQQLFGRTGGLHAAALFDSAGKLLVIREDIGRHNAVDKVIGWSLVKGLLPLSDCAMMVSGRGGFEIVQKALAAGVPLLASVSAPSSLAVKLAREMSLTLVGFLRDRRFVIYSNPERCRS
ncbi:formate dehydrogenase accessory sulfurtransferase FdhD [Telmatobacter sp. DSM 110680]|uniref:Sulfur carrier protein FdhD n=1 Tax=Telmatobacter sp. DSM 110680 TaxID=3036704 RepID=A0AAU7DKT4_9BACT